MLRSPFLLHIPHPSTCIPDEALGDFVVDRDTLDAELLRLTDRFTDAHSFPVTPLPTQVDVGDPPEIGIGTDAMHTSAALAEVVHTFFTDRAFRVGVNRPFAGALVPNAYYGRDQRVQSVMIEVRRDLYMDERTGERTPGLAEVQRVLTDFRALLEAWSLARGSVA